jgi:hypothetical protein
LSFAVPGMAVCATSKKSLAYVAGFAASLYSAGLRGRFPR